MKYKIVRLRFDGDVHFGEGMLETSGSSISADMLFSALCCELAGSGKTEDIEKLVSEVREGKLRISDTFPFSGQTLYLPRPYISVKADNDDGNSVKKKAFRKLKYIPTELYETFLKGEFTFEECKKAVDDISKISGFSLYEQVAVRSGEEDPEPYSVGKIRFRDNSGLWFILSAFDDLLLSEYEALIFAVGLSGIGGKRSSGCGRFTPEFCEVPGYLLEKLENDSGSAVSLSVCLPKNDEIESIIDDASYSLIKKSGFVYSETYSDTPHKKNDLYVFGAGSCFGKRFAGDVYDVSGDGKHKVYRYAVPMFMSIGGKS